jgi:hypothetical protein
MGNSWQYDRDIMGKSWEYHGNNIMGIISWEHHGNVTWILLETRAEYHGKISWETHGNITSLGCRLTTEHTLCHLKRVFEMSPFSWGVEETWSMFQKYVHIILEKLVTGIVYGNMMIVSSKWWIFYRCLMAIIPHGHAWNWEYDGYTVLHHDLLCPVASLSEQDLLNIWASHDLPMIFPWCERRSRQDSWSKKTTPRSVRIKWIRPSGIMTQNPQVKPRSQWTTSLAPCHMLWKILHCAFDGEIFSEIIWSNRAHVLDKLSPSEKNMDQYQGKKPYRTWIFWKRTLPMKPQVAGVPTLAMGQPMSR